MTPPVHPPGDPDLKDEGTARCTHEELKASSKEHLDAETTVSPSSIETLPKLFRYLGGMMKLSELMGDTAKRAVESTNVPQLMTALRSRVELAEGRLNNVADKSLGALEDELSGVRAEVRAGMHCHHTRKATSGNMKIIPQHAW